MTPTNAAVAGLSHHQNMSWVECDALERALRDDLLALPGCGQMHKDIQTRKNKAPKTLATMLVDGFRKERSPAKVTRLAHTIIGFFSSNAREQRRLRDLNPIETKEEGDINVVQMAIAQGDLSTPTLRKLVEQIDEYAPVLQEMRGAALAELMRGAR